MGLLLSLNFNRRHSPFYRYQSSPDDMKFHSSMTLLAHASAEPGVFKQALDQFFSGKDDEATTRKL